jgi:ABC-type amino acid transport substrate-binding protein
VFHEADSYGSKTDKGTWTGMMALVSNGVADIGISDFMVTKERSEVVAFLDAVEAVR